MCLVVMMYVRDPRSLRNLENLRFERGIDICHETVRLWWNRSGSVFATAIRRKRDAGSTIWPRTPTCPSDDDNGRC